MSLRELAVLSVLATGATAGGARAGEPLTLGGAVERALARSAEVNAAAAEVRAAEGRLEGASALLAANPELSGAAGSRRGPAERSAEWEVALSQRLEIGGQRGARVAAARAALAAAEARLGAARARVAAEVREALGRAAAARLRADVAAEARRLAEQAASAAERRFQAGDVARIEVNGARVERGRAARAAIQADEERRAALADLELALGAEPGASPEVAFTLEREGSGAEPDPDELVRAALATRLDLAAARLDVAAAEAEARLAARSAVPSPALGVSVAREEGADVVLGTLSIELPVFARNRAERAGASARLDAARGALASLERRAAGEVRLALERVRAARRMLDTLDPATVAALAEDVALVTKAYEAGQIELVRQQLLRREALEARRERIDALEALDRAEARLDLARGALPSR
jgi:cobalt-zinc-cadmium efflux system outer membrane protein